MAAARCCCCCCWLGAGADSTELFASTDEMLGPAPSFFTFASRPLLGSGLLLYMTATLVLGLFMIPVSDQPIAVLGPDNGGSSGDRDIPIPIPISFPTPSAPSPSRTVRYSPGPQPAFRRHPGLVKAASVLGASSALSISSRV